MSGAAAIWPRACRRSLSSPSTPRGGGDMVPTRAADCLPVFAAARGRDSARRAGDGGPGVRSSRSTELRPQPWKGYRLPTSRHWPEDLRTVLRVDADLDTAVLDRLNLIPGIEVISTCAGHPRGAHIGYGMVRGASLSGRFFARRLGARYLPRYLSFWLRPTVEPPPGGSLKWFEQTVTRMERAAADLLAST